MNMSELKFIDDLLRSIDYSNLEEDKVLRAISFVLNKIAEIVNAVADNASAMTEEDLIGVRDWE